MPNTPLPPAFRRLSWSNLFAQFSEQVALAAAPLAAVLLLNAGPSETGLLQTAQTLPFLLLAIPAGVLADRAARKRLMAGAEALRALSLLAILLLIATGWLDLPLLAALGFAGAIGTVCYSVAAPALTPALVPQAQLSDANRWLELCRSLAFVAGPALGGAAVGWMGASSAFALATALSLLALALLAGLPPEATPDRPRRDLMAQLREGTAFALTHPLLRPILVTAVLFNTAWFVLQAIYVAYAVQTLGLTPTGVGLTLATYGAGMVAGAVVAPALARRLMPGTMILIGPAFGFAAALVMLGTLWLPLGIMAGLSFFLFGAGPVLWTITTTTLRQRVTPQDMLGRVSATVLTATYGARPIGAALGALIAAQWGVGACLVAAAVGFALQLLVILRSPVPRLAALPDAVPA